MCPRTCNEYLSVPSEHVAPFWHARRRQAVVHVNNRSSRTLLKRHRSIPGHSIAAVRELKKEKKRAACGIRQEEMKLGLKCRPKTTHRAQADHIFGCFGLPGFDGIPPEGPSFAYSLTVHPVHTRRDRVASFD